MVHSLIIPYKFHSPTPSYLGQPYAQPYIPITPPNPNPNPDLINTSMDGAGVLDFPLLGHLTLAPQTLF